MSSELRLGKMFPVYTSFSKYKSTRRYSGMGGESQVVKKAKVAQVDLFCSL